MSYTLTFDEPGIVVIKYSGSITLQEAQVSSAEGVALARKHRVQLFLADHSESRAVLPIGQVHDLMDKIAAKTDVSRNAKLAVVLPPAGGEVRDNLESFATFASNQGWAVSVFDTHGEAIDWLTS
jgi:hypothetical protein